MVNITLSLAKNRGIQERRGGWQTDRSNHKREREGQRRFTQYCRMTDLVWLSSSITALPKHSLMGSLVFLPHKLFGIEYYCTANCTVCTAVTLIYIFIIIYIYFLNI